TSQIITQYEALCSLTKPLDATDCSHATLPDNLSKNRSKLILPLNRTRPFLRGTFDDRTDYINAVFVNGFKHKDAYIITQMPLENTVVDLYRLLRDHQSHTVVM
ncbi:unnamed protein product, partial [Owenia fusiformis]